ncbi:hypothetical protein CRG98_030857, partial [Punica granatum]
MDRPAPGLRIEIITPPRQDIMRIWRTLRPADHAFIQGIIGDVVMFTKTPALLAETVRSLDYVREVRRDRMRGSPHLLQIWLLAHIRPFCSSHPFSYIADERSLIERLVPVIPPPEHCFSEWRRFWRELTLARFLWVARWNLGGPMITGCPGIVGVPLLSHLGSTLIFPGQIREIRRQRDASIMQRLYFPEHPTDDEQVFAATSACVVRFYARGLASPQPSHAAPTPRATSTLAPEAESSTQAAMHAELRAIREERDRLRCELVDSRAEVADYRELQTELTRARARVAHLDREMARLSAELDRSTSAAAGPLGSPSSTGYLPILGAHPVRTPARFHTGPGYGLLGTSADGFPGVHCTCSDSPSSHGASSLSVFTASRRPLLPGTAPHKHHLPRTGHADSCGPVHDTSLIGPGDPVVRVWLPGRNVYDERGLGCVNPGKPDRGFCWYVFNHKGGRPTLLAFALLTLRGRGPLCRLRSPRSRRL